MRVALISRSSMYKIRGGDTIQVLKTAEELNKLGVNAEVFRACDIIPYDKFDLLHFFNIIRPSDHLYHINRSGKPFVVSTIYVDYTEFDRNRRNLFHKRFRRNLFHKSMLGLLGQSGAEYLKNLYRFANKQDKLVSPEYLLGHKRAIKTVFKKTSMILPNSNSELQRIIKSFQYSGHHQVVPNGVDLSLFGKIQTDVERQDKVLCVAHIYGLKNQLALINACKTLNVPLELVGSPTPNHVSYYELCKKIGGDLVSFTDFMPQEKLMKVYAGAKVHAMPSWFETTGLSSLEAGAMGCNLVVGTGGDTRDYYKADTWFCWPQEQESIEKALINALNTPNSMQLRETILSGYTWNMAAEVTLKAYKMVLNNPERLVETPE